MSEQFIAKYSKHSEQKNNPQGSDYLSQNHGTIQYKNLLNSSVSCRFFHKEHNDTTHIYNKYKCENNEQLNIVENNINYVKNTLGTQDIIVLHQVHGNDVIIIDKSNLDRNIFDEKLVADAAVTNCKGVALCIQTADCVPVLFFHKSADIIGAAHCGWKGARSDIIRNVVNAIRNLDRFPANRTSSMKTLEVEETKNKSVLDIHETPNAIANTSEKTESIMKAISGKKFNTDPDTDIIAIIGPAIQKESYEVDEKYYRDFISESSDYQQFFEKKQDSKKLLFDLPGFVKYKISLEGVKIEFCSEENTYLLPQKYPSYRRDANDNKRILSSIIMT